MALKNTGQFFLKLTASAKKVTKNCSHTSVRHIKNMPKQRASQYKINLDKNGFKKSETPGGGNSFSKQDIG